VPVTWPAAPPVRLMGDLGLRGVRRAKSARTTRSASREQCPADLVKRHFSAFRPNELWVADIAPQAGGAPSYVRTFSGWVYVAFITDLYSRRIIGWQTTYRPACTDLAAGALQMAVWQRKRQGADLTGLVHHLRPWGAVQVHPLRAGPVRLRGSRLGGGRRATPFGFALAEALKLLVQGRAHPQPRTLAGHRRHPRSPPPSRSTGTGTTRPHSAVGTRTPAEHEDAWAPDTHRHEQPQTATTATRQTSHHKTQGLIPGRPRPGPPPPDTPHRGTAPTTGASVDLTEPPSRASLTSTVAVYSEVTLRAILQEPKITYQ